MLTFIVLSQLYTLQIYSLLMSFPVLGLCSRCQIPCVLSVDRKDLFNVAAEKLGFFVEAEKTLPIGGEFVTVIKVANMWARASFQRETKEFYGEFASTNLQSIQSAYHVALGYLEKEKMVVIDDYNSEYIVQLRSDLFRFKSWAMLHELDAESLRKKVKAVAVALRGLLSSVKTMLGTSQFAQEDKVSKRARYHAGASFPGKSAAASEDHGLSNSVSRFEATLSSLFAGSLQEECTEPHQPKEEEAGSSTRMQ